MAYERVKHTDMKFPMALQQAMTVVIPFSAFMAYRTVLSPLSATFLLGII